MQHPPLQKLSHAVSKFAGCIKKIHDRSQSGLSEDDKKNKALELYHQMEHENFTFMYAWDVLRKEEKWLSQLYEKTEDIPSTEQTGSKRNKTNTSNNYVQLERRFRYNSPSSPPGRKASKAKGKTVSVGVQYFFLKNRQC